MLRTILEEVGHEVIEAADGVEAVATYRARRPGLVVMDIFMPRQDGIETLVRLREEFGAIKVIAISGGGGAARLRILPDAPQADVLDVARHLGANVCIPKPFEISTILAAVNLLLIDSAA